MSVLLTEGPGELSPEAEAKQKNFVRFALALIAYTLFVIVWGVLVRATGSGAGCGSHWPLCDGQVLPFEPSTETIIEYTHRVTSGLAMVGAVVLPFWARKVFPKGHLALKAAWWALGFMITEALVGAGLVVFEKVAHDTSLARGFWMGAHLINTFLLVAAQSLTLWWAKFGFGTRRSTEPRILLLVGLGVLGMMLLGVSGAIAALGDTLFPSESLREGMAADFSGTAHLFVRLRVFHPLIAVLVASYIFFAGNLLAEGSQGHRPRLARLLVALFFVQLFAGVVNWLLLAPVWMQLVHLLLADFVWMTFVVLSAESLLPREDSAVAEVSILESRTLEAG